MKKYKKGLVVLAIVLVLLGTILFTMGKGSTLGENFLGTVAKPFTGFFNGVGSFFGSVGKNPDAQLLRSENEELRRQNVALDELKAENERLRALVNYQEKNVDYEYQAVGIRARSSNYWFNTFTITAGKTSGIAEGMPLVSDKGLVGKVTEVGATWSKVSAIIDSASAVAVMAERTRDNGTIRSELDVGGGKYRLKLEHLPVDSTVQPGDSVITSGLGGTYPKGVMVGTISEVEQLQDGTKVVWVEPVTDFYRLEKVLIMKAKKTPELLG